MAACFKISMHLSELTVQSQTKTMTSMIYEIYLTCGLIRPFSTLSLGQKLAVFLEVVDTWLGLHKVRVLSCIWRYNDKLCLLTVVFQSVSEAIVSVINAGPPKGSKVTNIQF